MANTPNLDEMLAAALKAVRATDWNAWQPQPGDAWIVEHLFGDEPPLTNGILQAYLAYCAWIWRRPITPLEQQRVTNELLKRWTSDSFAMDYSWLQEVLSFVWLIGGLQSAAPKEQEAVRGQLAQRLQNGAFPGIDTPVPGIAVAKQALGPTVAPSTLRSPQETDAALDGLYLATTFGLQLNIYGRPGSGSWGSQTELYAFFPDGRYLYFPSRQEAGAHLKDPRGHKARGGSYEISSHQIKIYNEHNGQTHTSDFSVSTDGKELKFYGKTFTRIADTTGLRA